MSWLTREDLSSFPAGPGTRVVRVLDHEKLAGLLFLGVIVVAVTAMALWGR